MRYGRQDLSGQHLGEEHGALGLATAAEAASGAATKRQKVLGSAFWATDPCKTSLKPATSQELLYRMHNNRPQRS
jgi:hypothetical protein